METTTNDAIMEGKKKYLHKYYICRNGNKHAQLLLIIISQLVKTIAANFAFLVERIKKNLHKFSSSFKEFLLHA